MINALNKSLLVATFMHFFSPTWASFNEVEVDIPSQEEKVKRSSRIHDESLALILVPQQKKFSHFTLSLVKDLKNLRSCGRLETFNPRPWYLKSSSTVRKLLVAEQVRKSFIVQLKDLTLSPAPRQHRPFLYKFTPPEGAKNLKKFSLLGTTHTYPYFMMPSSVLKAVSKARQVVTESGDGDIKEDHLLIKQELESAGVIVNVSSQAKHLVKKELDFWKTWSEQKITEDPLLYTEEWKARFLQEKQAYFEQEIAQLLSNWGSSLSKEENEYALELLNKNFYGLNLKDISRFHPAALTTLLHLESSTLSSVTGIDDYLNESAHQANKHLYGLDSVTLMISLATMKKHINSLNLHNINALVESIPLLLEPFLTNKTSSFAEEMRELFFYQYHQGNFAEDSTVGDNFWSNESYLRTQAWLPKIEKYIRLKGTFIAVGLAHVPDILAWVEDKGYTVKRSEN